MSPFDQDRTKEPAKVTVPNDLRKDQNRGQAARDQDPREQHFPTLTEVMSVPRYASNELPDSLAEVEWADLAQKVRDNVLERLTRRSEMMMEAQLKSTLEAITKRTAESLAIQLEDSLSQLLREVVARAVNEEITRLQTEIQRRKPG
jgi:hypothetical protein